MKLRRGVRRALGVAVLSGAGLFAQHAVADTITGFIYNNTSFSQTSNAPPVSPAGYFFAIGASFENPGDFTSGSASYPGPGSPQNLPAYGPTELNFNSPFYGSLADLHSDYPFGTYSITAN